MRDLRYARSGDGGGVGALSGTVRDLVVGSDPGFAGRGTRTFEGGPDSAPTSCAS